MAATCVHAYSDPTILSSIISPTSISKNFVEQRTWIMWTSRAIDVKNVMMSFVTLRLSSYTWPRTTTRWNPLFLQKVICRFHLPLHLLPCRRSLNLSWFRHRLQMRWLQQASPIPSNVTSAAKLSSSHTSCFNITPGKYNQVLTFCW